MLQIGKELINHDPDAFDRLQRIARVFESAGKRIFLVGGAVRSLVLGTYPNDFDLASDALPQEVMKMFRTVIPTGIQHGTVTVIFEKHSFEITTFRIDGEYSDGRRPDEVAFTDDLHEDLRRRDFTINAMAVSLKDLELHDPHGGTADLEAHLIRTVGNPRERFSEDPLRIVRALRFACQLGFRIDEETWAAMRLLESRLAGVSVERYREELVKILKSRRSSWGIRQVLELGIHALFAPVPFKEDQRQSRYAAAARADEDALEDMGERETFGLHLLGTNAQGVPDLDALRALKLPRAQIDSVCALAEGYRQIGRWQGENPEPADLRRLASSIGPVQGRFAIAASGALLGKGVELWLKLYDETLESRPPLTIGDLAIGGDQLFQLGFARNKRMGEVLRSLLAGVLENPASNTRESLTELAKNML